MVLNDEVAEGIQLAESEDVKLLVGKFPPKEVSQGLPLLAGLLTFNPKLSSALFLPNFLILFFNCLKTKEERQFKKKHRCFLYSRRIWIHIDKEII